MEDCYSLWYYNIKDEAILRLDYIEITIHIMMLSGKEIGLEVLPHTATIADVKARVIKYQEDFKSEELGLMFEGKKLEDSKRLMHYKIYHGDKLGIYVIGV